MARAPAKHERDQALDWEMSMKDSDKRMKPEVGKGASVSSSLDRKVAGGAPKVDSISSTFGQYSYPEKYDAISSLHSNLWSDGGAPSAASEKEQGNDYFKQKKFKEAINCYSSSIALSPTAVAHANRAMAYLKIKRFQEAEDDCTEALLLDDRYVKAYSRRSTARKELKKYKESMEDAEFAMKLEPNNQEVKKQYSEAKSLYEKELLQRTAGALQRTVNGPEKTKDAGVRVQELSGSSNRSQKVSHISSQKEDYTKTKGHSSKLEPKPSVEELAVRAASQALNEAAENITPPSSAYQFEVTWRGFSGNRALQARLLKATPPSALPQLFKNALTSAILVDIINCLATVFNDEMELTVQFLENLTKVSRFDMVVMCLSSADRIDLSNIWKNVFSNSAIPMEFAERLDSIRARYCPSC